jgi:hypothetical protein
MANRMTWTALVLSVAVVTLGCVPASPTGKGPTKPVEVHPTEGPHGGALIEWGDEEYHLEFTVDRAKKQTTVYVLDESARKAKPITAETLTMTLKHVAPPATVTLKAEPMEGEEKGTSSRFVGTDDRLGEAGPFKGDVRGKVGGTPYSGGFTEKKEAK